MAQLIDLKESIRSFYQKNAAYIRPVMKIFFSFLILVFISRMFGYNARINKLYIFFIVSVMQAFLPVSFLYYVSAVVIAGNLWVVSVEIMLIFLAVIIACSLAFVRIDRRYAVLVILTPVLFYLKLEYLMPVLVGMISGTGGLLPVAGGILVYFISVYTRDVSALLATTSGNEAGVGVQRMIHLITIDKKLLVVVIVFCLIIFMAAILYRIFDERAWMFTVASGNIVLALLLLSGRLIFELDYTIWRVFLECILAVALAVIYQFFRGIGDISRIEKVTFEDDEYIYYVKAVPKIKVSLTERNVTRIQPEEDFEEGTPADDTSADDTPANEREQEKLPEGEEGSGPDSNVEEVMKNN